MNQPSDITALHSEGRTPVRSPEELRNLLCRTAGQPIHLTLTRNRVSMVSVRFGVLSPPRIRLSQVFLHAHTPVLLALGDYLKTRSKTSWRQVCDFVSSREHESGALRPASVRTMGRVYDLARIRDRINTLYFKGAMDCRIGWAKPGKRQRHARTRSLRYGTYNKTLNLIRINPVLDDHRVPAEFVDYIVFHEMLHAVVPSEKGRGRWRHHQGSFRILERQYPNLARMQTLASQLVTVLGG